MRRDIQFLRGIAVLAVVFYHADIVKLQSGFLGVDIFFVISGFLITSLILRGIEENSFSYTDFYKRRAHRLLPALYSTLLVTTLASYVFLTHRQWDDYLQQLLGAVTFTSNMVLPYQVGYFDDAAETRPLLHIWSLSLEEQYYFLLPPLLALCAKRWIIPLLVALTGLSLLACLAALQMTGQFLGLSGSEIAFYTFPTRAWELLAGSLLSVWMLHRPSFTIPRGAKWFAVMALLALLFFSIDPEHPRGNALLVVLLTCLLIVGKDNWLPKFRMIDWIARVGDCSYSLYLIHWPLLAFAQIAYLGAVPTTVRIGLVFTAFVLSVAQYRFIETPFRASRNTSNYRSFAMFAAMTAVLLLAAAPPATQSLGLRETPGPDFAEIRRKNFGIHRICVLKPPFEIPGRCKTKKEPEVAVWGDSYAMHLVPGLRKNPATNDSIIQLTRSGCTPSSSLAHITKGTVQARQCMQFNARALRYILDSPSIENVVLSSPFGYFYNTGHKLLIRGKAVPYKSDLVIADLTATVRALISAGKRPLIISPPVYAGYNVGECLEREMTGALILGRNGCELSLKFHSLRQKPVVDGLSQVSKATGVPILWLSDLMCDGTSCQTQRNGVPLYRDKGHLTDKGSEILLGNSFLW
ncbi:acyltransferase family protein [Congregibacter sp.]|uniref:acyltransferase family protein n=1 Tax=Congregibacter sp. TaxID=2744308 RepID=UPI003F6C958C